MDNPNAVSLNILVVDDDDINRRMMEIILKRLGHVAKFAVNGLDALDAIKLSRFDIIFMDLQMPIMDGVEASRQIRAWETALGYNTFVVALTANYLPEKGSELFDAGIDNYIPKPFRVEQIQQMLNYCMKSSAVTQIDVSTATLNKQDVLNTQAGMQYVGGDSEVYAELLADFIGDLPERLAVIQRCFQDSDSVGLSRAAHNLKGVAANLGALKLSECARGLESGRNAGYTTSIVDLLEEIRVCATELEKAGQVFLSNGT